MVTTNNQSAMNGRVIESLVVKLDLDMSGFKAGMRMAMRDVQEFKRSVVAEIGGVTVSDAINAALVAPLLVAATRIGQVRNEMRELANELRNMPRIGGPGSPGGGGGAGGLLAAGAAGAAGGAILDMQRATGADGKGVVARGSNGKFVRSFEFRSPGDATPDNFANADLSGGKAGLAALGGAALGSARASATHDMNAERERKRYDRLGRGVSGAAASLASDAKNAAGMGRGGYFSDMFQRNKERTSEAFSSAKENFPNMGGARDNLGVDGAAQPQGARIPLNGMRGIGAMLGGQLGGMLGMFGLGAVVNDLLRMLPSLATMVGGTLAGAFAALLTPLGLVVAALTALGAIWVAANWDNFVEFGEWLGERGKEVLGEGWDNVLAAFENVKKAVTELWEVISGYLGDDSGSLTGVLKFFGEVVIRVFRAALEVIAGFGNVLAEVIRSITALLEGDAVGAFEHFGTAVAHIVQTVINVFKALLPEIAEIFANMGDSLVKWANGKFTEFADAVVGKVMQVQSAFKNLAEAVVLNSYVPDMVEGIGKEFDKLKEKMVDPAVKATGDVKKAFEDTAESVEKSNEKIAKGGKKSKAGASESANDNEAGYWKNYANQSVNQNLYRETFYALDGGGFEPKRILDGVLLDIKYELQTDLAETITGGIRGAISKIGDYVKSEEFSNLLGSVFSWVVGLFGGSGSSGGSSSGFAGFFAEGGFIPPGAWGVVGEEGPEIIRGGRAGATVYPNSTMGGQVAYNDNRSYDLRGASVEAVARLERQIERDRREMPALIGRTVGEMRRRTGTF